jgi:hypothetical protein
MAGACRLSSIRTFGAQVLSTVILQLQREAPLFQDFQLFSAIAVLPAAVLKHDPAVSWQLSHVTVNVFFFSNSCAHQFSNAVDDKTSDAASGSDVRLFQ